MRIWFDRCCVEDCHEVGDSILLFQGKACRVHFSQYYFDDGSRLEFTKRRYASFVAVLRWVIMSLRDVRRLKGDIGFRLRMLRTDITWPFIWHVPSVIGWLRRWHKCGHCDRYLCREINKRGIWICASCEEHSYSESGATFGGDAGRNQQCVTCGQPAESEVYGKPYCHPHGHEAHTGEPYVPPTEEQKRAWSAMASAMLELMEDGEGPTTVTREWPMRSTMAVMDGEYLSRLSAKIEEKLVDKPPESTP